MNAARTALLAVMVIGSAVLVSIPERAGADGPPPGAIEIIIEDEPDEDVSIGTIPDDPDPAEPEAPPSASPPKEVSQPEPAAPAPAHNPPAAAPPQVQKPVTPVVKVAETPPEPEKPCPDGKPHNGGKDGVIPASGNTNDDCDHSVAPPAEPAAKPDAPAAKPVATASAKAKASKPKLKPKAKKRTKPAKPIQVVYVQPALANSDPNASRAGYCHDGSYYDLVEGQPSWDPKYAGYTPAVNGSCPATPPVKVVVLSPPPADPGTSRAGYCYKGRYADLLVNQPSWDPQWAGATPATNGRC